MRFMALVIPGDPTAYENGKMPDPKLLDDMGKFNEELAKAGVLLGLDGLQPTSKGTRIKFGGPKPTVTDGPFAEAREVIGGYWIWKVASNEEAVEWAKRAPMEKGATIELRRIFEPSDFGPELAARRATFDQRLASESELIKTIEQNQRA